MEHFHLDYGEQAMHQAHCWILEYLVQDISLATVQRKSENFSKNISVMKVLFHGNGVNFNTYKD